MSSGLVTQRTRVNSARSEFKDGKEWLVAPVVALVPGVLNEELVLAEEISRYTPAWDDSPVTVYHPHDGRSHVSARSIDMLEAYQAGRLYDVRFEDGRLKGDVWLDVDRIGKFGESGSMILNQIMGGTGCEVSTGYFRDAENTPGVYNGRPYRTVARNIRPDHLALLPEAEGACNWSDGCGVPRTNKKEPSMTDPQISVNQGLAQRVLAALAAAFGVTGAARSSARTPSYDGVEDTSWGDVDKSLSAYIAGYNDHGGGSEEGSSVGDISQACKRWIASKTLLGDASAETVDDLIFFPVVNPSTDNLNLGALRAVLSGRGAQADIPESALESARAKAQSLLDDNSDDEETAENAASGKGIISLFLEDSVAKSLALTAGDLPAGSIIIEPANLSIPLVSYSDGQATDATLGYLAGELAGLARSTAVMVAPITGIGRLMTGGEYDTLYLTIGGQAVQRWAFDLGGYLSFFAYLSEEEGREAPVIEVLPVSLPIAYIPKDAQTPSVSLSSMSIAFSHIGVECGGSQIVFGLAGELRPAPSSPGGETEFTTYDELTQMMALAKNARSAEIEAEKPNGDEDMNDRRQLIETLIASANCQCTREALEAMSTDDLKVMADNILADDELDAGETIPMPGDPLEPPTPEDVQENEDDSGVETQAETQAEEAETLDEPADNEQEVVETPQFTAIPAEIEELIAVVREFGGVSALRDALASVQANAADERASLIDSLIANSRCAFSAEQLAGFTTENLRLLSASLEPTDFSAKPRPNGRTTNQKVQSVLVEIPMPSL